MRCGAPRGGVVVHRPYGRSGRRGVILVAERGIEDGVRVSVAAPATEDETTSHSSKGPVYLDDHARRVACLAESFARALDLEETNDLGLAALLHDGGKADPRFQVMLSGGDPWNRPDDRPLAKSGRVWSPTTRANAALPRGWRHEALSVRMARAHPRMAGARDRALVLWLIGTHHGLRSAVLRFPRPAAGNPGALPGCERLALAGGTAGTAVAGFRSGRQGLAAPVRGSEATLRDLGSGAFGSNPASCRSPGPQKRRVSRERPREAPPRRPGARQPAGLHGIAWACFVFSKRCGPSGTLESHGLSRSRPSGRCYGWR